MRNPPKHSKLPPRKLFRLLAGGSRPRLPLTLPWLDTSGLSVRALSAAEVDDVFGHESTEELRGVELESASIEQTARFVVAVLEQHGRPAYTMESIGDVSTAMIQALFRESWSVFSMCSPMYGWSDMDAWGAVLREGAIHDSNLAIRRGIIAARAHIAGTPEFVAAPEKFFGARLSEVIDGQWMAFDAAWSTRVR